MLDVGCWEEAPPKHPASSIQHPASFSEETSMTEFKREPILPTWCLGVLAMSAIWLLLVGFMVFLQIILGEWKETAAALGFRSDASQAGYLTGLVLSIVLGIAANILLAHHRKAGIPLGLAFAAISLLSTLIALVAAPNVFFASRVTLLLCALQLSLSGAYALAVIEISQYINRLVEG
jgi:hypothetical protein